MVKLTIDIIIQHDSRGNVGVDCGVHVCVWGYIILTGSNFYFSAEEMNKISRYWILKKILSVANEDVLDTTPRFLMGERSNTPFKNMISRTYKRIKISRNIPNNAKNTIEYCSGLILSAIF